MNDAPEQHTLLYTCAQTQTQATNTTQSAHMHNYTIALPRMPLIHDFINAHTHATIYGRFVK